MFETNKLVFSLIFYIDADSITHAVKYTVSVCQFFYDICSSLVFVGRPQGTVLRSNKKQSKVTIYDPIDIEK